MLSSGDLLRAYVQLIRQVSRAAVASLYLPVPSVLSSKTVLLHQGEGAPVPELADLGTAAQFSRMALQAKPRNPASFRQLPSRLAGGRLIGIPPIESLMLPNSSPRPSSEGRKLERRRTDDPEAWEAAMAWLGLRFEDGSQANSELLLALDRSLGETETSRDWWTWLLAVGGAMAWHTRWVSDLLHDPISLLPGRTELQGVLRQAIGRTQDGGESSGLLLINPDDFDVVNERFGREAGDRVIREIADRLRGELRRSDFACRYGGAVFAVVLPGASQREAAAVAAKILPALTEGAYRDGAVRLSFSSGIATTDSPLPESPDEASSALIQRADRALNAAKISGGRIVAWKPDAEFEEVGHLDRLSGIFTASLTKDYRNMLLLWDTVSIVAASADSDELVERVVERLAHTFRPARARLFMLLEEEGGWAAWSADGHREPEAGGDARPDAWLTALLDEARHGGQPRATRLPADESVKEEDELACCAVPLTTGDLCIGCLYLEGAAASLRLDASDLVFLEALARQLAVALDRARLAEQERSRQELERRRLRSELHDLRQALQQAKLVHRSSQMDGVLAAARRAATTDATILIRGESGTGKELLARTIHELSPRRHKPLVLVDCSAIATSLIDSELFGHTRGAFTGATESSAGRLAEAAGGTVLLDEIGELPLEVQGKLLRFVQEKQLMPVGSNRQRRVDARVIAVTNRDLAAEVDAGRFRQDLYYRLNVVHLVIPPLRQRPDDVALLARYFLGQYTVQYQKAIRGLTPQAEALLDEHPWPGNVRELQNRVMQAVIFCDGEWIGPADLKLEAGAAAAQTAAETATGSPEEGSTGGGWEALRAALGRRLDAALEGQPPRPLPFGRWLSDDLVLAAHDAARTVGRKAAALLGVPESTFRRRWRKARAEADAGLAPRTDEWRSIRARVADLIARGNDGDENLLEIARDLLLQVVLSRLPSSPSLGAAFMGVTEPTFRRWGRGIAARAADGETGAPS